MPPLEPNDLTPLMHRGLDLHRRGLLEQAETVYRQVLAIHPNHADALHLLGVIALQTGRNDVAAELISKAIALAPQQPAYRANLAEAYRAAGQLDRAIAEYRSAIGLKPDYVEVYNNLGIALERRGHLDEAIAAYRCAIKLRPDLAEAHSNLGNVLRAQGQLDQAIDSYRAAIRFKHNYAQGHNNLGVALKEQGQLDQAIDAYFTAIQLQPDLAEAHGNLGVVFAQQGKLDEAMAAYRAAIQLDPNYTEAYYNLGNALKDQGRSDLAAAAYQRAIQLNPDYAQAHTNLGNALRDLGQLDQAVAEYRLAIQLKPSYADVHSNLISTLHYHPGYDARAIAEELRRWNLQHAEPLKQFIRPHLNDRQASRRLRVGYVSPDFNAHPVGRFILPLLANHDKHRFEVFAYAQVSVPDEMTERLRSHTHCWRSIVGLTDDQVADLIREDQIDILVDLTMHTDQNRLLVFARKPAPVQITYLACCSSTGLDAIDYRLSDGYLDPPGIDESIYSEKTVRLPETYWCFEPAVAAPDPGALPARAAGHIVFACLGHSNKVNDSTLSVWANLLREVPTSHLLLHAGQEIHRRRVWELLEGQGIARERIKFTGSVPIGQYYELYQGIDIALDTFPYAGGTTTCDALWMGVPVISFAGPTAAGRGGASILSNIGLPDLIANSQIECVRRATQLAQELARLENLRSTLRRRMSVSPLMDAPRFAKAVEESYRNIWRNWCVK